MKRKDNETTPLLMTEEFWRNSQLSVARFYGGVEFNGRRYVIVNKDGIDLFALSLRCGEGEKAIPAGEPADLILRTLQPAYSTLGRERIIELIKEDKNEAEIIRIAKEEHKKSKNKHIIGTAEHIKTALGVMDKKGGEQ